METTESYLFCIADNVLADKATYSLPFSFSVPNNTCEIGLWDENYNSFFLASGKRELVVNAVLSGIRFILYYIDLFPFRIYKLSALTRATCLWPSRNGIRQILTTFTSLTHRASPIPLC